MSRLDRIERDWLTPPEDNRCVKALCDFCGEEIREGDLVYTSPFKHICKGCIDGMTAINFISDVLEEKLERA